MKCTICRAPAVIDLRRHNANFCDQHFIRLCHDQVGKAIKEFDMLERDDHVVIGISGGKDSLGLWDILHSLGYRTTGVYLGLGIGEYSESSQQFAAAFADERNLELRVVDIASEYGFSIPDGARVARRPACSGCGLTKRHVLDAQVGEIGGNVLATGHNLDDEAAVLFGNTMHWHLDYLARQQPVLEPRNGLPRKVKPLIRLGEREMAAYCLVRGIDYIVEECPMAKGNRHLTYKAALNQVELESPGAKADFVLGFFRTARQAFSLARGTDEIVLGNCSNCGAATTSEVCSFCRFQARATCVEITPRDHLSTR